MSTTSRSRSPRTAQQGLDVAFDFAGVPPVRDQALGVLGKKGRPVLIGLANQPVTIASDTFFAYMQQQVLGSYGSEPSHVEELVKLADQGRLDLSRSVSGVLPLSEAPDAVARLDRKEGNPVRPILKP